jgi:hypothetical protein
MQPGRPRRTRSLAIVLAVLVGAGLAGKAAAAESKVLSAGAAQPAVVDLPEVCCREAGHDIWIIGSKAGRGQANIWGGPAEVFRPER